MPDQWTAIDCYHGTVTELFNRIILWPIRQSFTPLWCKHHNACIPWRISIIVNCEFIGNGQNRIWSADGALILEAPPDHAKSHRSSRDMTSASQDLIWNHQKQSCHEKSMHVQVELLWQLKPQWCPFFFLYYSMILVPAYVRDQLFTLVVLKQK